MASGLTVRKSGALRPAHCETVFCKTLVVGNSIAAYTATLAILQAGGQVCWAQTGTQDLVTTLNRQQRSQQAESRFSWRQGRRISPWEDATVMSQSQQVFWANWQPSPALPAAPSPAPPTAALSEASAVPPLARQSKADQLRQAIQPYLQSQQLILIPQGRPVRVLYSQQRGQRRVHQVVFQDPKTRHRFQVHARLILDATTEGVLQQDLATASESTLVPEHQLTLDETIAAVRQAARGQFFTDSIAVVMANGLDRRAKPRPLSVPLRSLVLENTEGFLSVSLPGCEPSLRPVFQHPRAQWALGEAAGQVAARAAQAGSIEALRSAPNWEWTLQQTLVRQGIPIFAFDDIALDDPDFEPIQMAAIANVVRTMRRRDLSFRPETPVTKAVLASALARLPKSPALSTTDSPVPLADVTSYHWAEQAIQQAIATQTLPPETDTTFRPSKVLSKRQLWQVVQPLYPTAPATLPFSLDETPARRRHLSRSLYPILQLRLGS